MFQTTNQYKMFPNVDQDKVYAYSTVLWTLHAHDLKSHENYIWLVVSTTLKNMKVKGKDYPVPYIMENKKCSKPPTIYIYMYICIL